MKNIIKNYFLIVGFLTTVFMVLFCVLIFKLINNIREITPRVTEKEKILSDKPYYLKLDLVGTIKDRHVSDFTRFFQFLEGREEYKLYDLINTLDLASQDERIKGLVIKRLNVRAELNSIIELSDALKRFREKGKKVYVFLNEANNKNYLLASAADQIFFQKEGSLYVPGISASLIYIKDTLAKVGIEAEFLKTGQYKSAPEIFTSNSMSEDTRNMTTSLLGDIQENFITTIAKNRNLNPDEVIDFSDKALLIADEALERKLVDELAYRDEFQEAVEEKFFPEIKSLDFDDYAQVSPKSIKGVKIDRRRKIGLIIASGPIQMAARGHQFDEPVILPSRILKELKKGEEDSSIKALILRVNSPGGSALASDIIWNAVRKLNIRKPVFVSMGNVAASGGYYISMGAERIYAGKTTITGSIGVFGGKFVASKLMDKIGAHPETITFSEGASLFSAVQDFTPQQRLQLQGYLDNTYQSFVTKAALGRNKEYEELDKVAQGRVWTGRQAREVGLVDGVGGYYEVIQAVKEKIGIKEDVFPTVVRIRVSSGTLLDRLRYFSLHLKEKLLPISAFKATLKKQIARLTTVKDLLTKEKALYLMPYSIEIQ